MGPRPSRGTLDVLQLGIFLLGVTLGWLILFAIRRNKIHWGPFATFLGLVLGSGLLNFLYAENLPPYYGIGLFAGFFGNLVVRGVGVAVGGRVGKGLLEVAALSRTSPTTRGNSKPLEEREREGDQRTGEVHDS